MSDKVEATFHPEPRPGVRPVRFANYPGDVSHMLGEIVGPNTLGEFLTAVQAAYYPETDTTRVGFAYGIRVVEIEVPS